MVNSWSKKNFCVILTIFGHFKPKSCSKTGCKLGGVQQFRKWRVFQSGHIGRADGPRTWWRLIFHRFVGKFCATSDPGFILTSRCKKFFRKCYTPPLICRVQIRGGCNIFGGDFGPPFKMGFFGKSDLKTSKMDVLGQI